jgi:hypothetical protein
MFGEEAAAHLIQQQQGKLEQTEPRRDKREMYERRKINHEEYSVMTLST